MVKDGPPNQLPIEQTLANQDQDFAVVLRELKAFDLKKLKMLKCNYGLYFRAYIIYTCICINAICMPN